MPEEKQWKPLEKIETEIFSDKTSEVRGEDYLSLTKEIQVGAGNRTFKVSDQGMWLGSEQFSTAPFSVSMAGVATLPAIDLTSGTIRYRKTSFADSANAGYILCSQGIYAGGTTDATKLKFTIADGSLDLIGTVSGRSTATLAAAINSSGSLITDIVNARLDTTTKRILSDFNFGAVDYAGALMAGNVTWNTSTGTISGGSGVLVYRSGIVGVANGSATFTLDASTGSAVFAGTLTAPVGTLGTLQIASGGHIRLGQTAYNTGKGFWIGDDSGTTKFSVGSASGGEYMTWDGQFLVISSGDLQIVPSVGNGAPVLVVAGEGTNTYGSGACPNYTKVKEVKILRAGTYKVCFNLCTNSSPATNLAYGRIYKNGVAVGTERSNTDSANGGTQYCENFTFAYGDLVQLYVKEGGDGVKVRNFYFYVRASMGGEIILD